MKTQRGPWVRGTPATSFFRLSKRKPGIIKAPQRHPSNLPPWSSIFFAILHSSMLPPSFSLDSTHNSILSMRLHPPGGFTRGYKKMQHVWTSHLTHKWVPSIKSGHRPCSYLSNYLARSWTSDRALSPKYKYTSISDSASDSSVAQWSSGHFPPAGVKMDAYMHQP